MSKSFLRSTALTPLLAITLAFAPAGAMPAPHLSASVARAASRFTATQTLASLLSHRNTPAPIRIGHCQVKANRGTCPVLAKGTQTCRYTSHVVLRRTGAYFVWAEHLRCNAS